MAGEQLEDFQTVLNLAAQPGALKSLGLTTDVGQSYRELKKPRATKATPARNKKKVSPYHICLRVAQSVCLFVCFCFLTKFYCFHRLLLRRTTIVISWRHFLFVPRVAVGVLGFLNSLLFHLRCRPPLPSCVS